MKQKTRTTKLQQTTLPFVPKSLTFDSRVRSAVFFSWVLAFTSIFCFSYVSLRSESLWNSLNNNDCAKKCQISTQITRCMYINLSCTCCVSTFCNSPSATVTSESSSEIYLRIFQQCFFMITKMKLISQWMKQLLNCSCNRFRFKRLPLPVPLSI